MRTISSIFVATVAMVLAGCASSPQGMRDDPEAKRSGIIKVNYQVALKRLNNWYRECVWGPLLPIGQSINEIVHLPELREASIVRGSSGFGTQITAVIELRGIDDQTTELTTYKKEAFKGKFFDQQRNIAEGDDRCP